MAGRSDGTDEKSKCGFVAHPEQATNFAARMLKQWKRETARLEVGLKQARTKFPHQEDRSVAMAARTKTGDRMMAKETTSTRTERDAERRPAPAPRESHRPSAQSRESRATLSFFVCALCHPDTCGCYARCED